MKIFRFRHCTTGLILLLMFGGVSTAQTQAPPTTDVEEEALALLRQSMVFVSKAPSFQLSAEIGFDVIQESGQKIEFGATRQVTIRRPDKARIEFTRRDGVNGAIVFDGKKLLVFNNDDKVYAQTPLEGDIDQAFDTMAEELQMPVPMRDFFANAPFEVLAEKLTSGFYVGEAVVAGIPCDHLAFRNDRVDFQIWIATGDKPLPRRFVISYRQEEGQPQFWVQFLKWDLAPEVPDTLFSTKAPEGAELIPFAILDPSLNEERGTP